MLKTILFNIHLNSKMDRKNLKFNKYCQNCHKILLIKSVRTHLKLIRHISHLTSHNARLRSVERSLLMLLKMRILLLVYLLLLLRQLLLLNLLLL